MSTRRIAYCTEEGGLYWPWPPKSGNFDQPIVFWSDGKVYDAVCERRGLKRDRNTVEEAMCIKEAAADNVKKYPSWARVR